VLPVRIEIRLLTNPELLRATISQGGMNLVRGTRNALEDWPRTLAGQKPVGADAFVPGKAVAVTPGAVATAKDHVAPWRSVYKLMLLEDTEVTFLLTSGGHNAGIVSEPGHPRRSYQIATRAVTDKYVDPETWQAITPIQPGSWWPAWQAWLAARSSGLVAPPASGAPQRGYPPLDDAPGAYVFQS